MLGSQSTHEVRILWPIIFHDSFSLSGSFSSTVLSWISNRWLLRLLFCVN